jgi:MFS family permease
VKRWKKTFYIIWAGQFVSTLTSSVVSYAIIFWLSIQTKSAEVLAYSTLASMLPHLILGIFTGVFIDRWNRKKVMILSDLYIAAVTVVMAILFYFGDIHLWILFILLAFRSIGSAFHGPAMEASVPLLAPKDKLMKVAGVNNMIYSISTIASPAIAALFINLLDMTWVLMLDVAGALIACTSLYFVHIPNPKDQLLATKPDQKFHLHNIVENLGKYTDLQTLDKYKKNLGTLDEYKKNLESLDKYKNLESLDEYTNFQSLSKDAKTQKLDKRVAPQYACELKNTIREETADNKPTEGEGELTTSGLTADITTIATTIANATATANKISTATANATANKISTATTNATTNEQKNLDNSQKNNLTSFKSEIHQFILELKQGILAIKSKPKIMWMFILTIFASLAMVPVSTLFPLMTLEHFAGDTFKMSLIEIAWGLGMLVGGIFISISKSKNKESVLINSSYIVLGTTFLLSGFLPPNAFYVFAVLSAIGGIAGAIFWGAFTVLLQRSIEPGVLGRVFSIHGSLIMIPAMFSLVATGYIADAIGITNTFICGGGALILIGAFSFRL